MRGKHLRQSEVAIGMRWVTASRIMQDLQRSRLENAAVETVVDFDREAIRLGHNMRVTLECGGERRDVIMAHTDIVAEKGRRIFWVDPLPADDDVALRFVEAAFMDPKMRSATLLWVAAAGEDIAYAHLVTDDRHHSDGLMRHDGQMRTSIAARAVRFTSKVSPGDLVAIIVGKSHIEGGVIVHVPKAELTIQTGMTLADAAAIPSYQPRRSEFASGNFDGSHKLEEEDDWAIAHNEPSEALVLVHMDGDKANTVILASSGAAFHHQEDVDVLIQDQIPGAGLWAYTNAKVHGWTSHEGEYDMDMSGDVAPADDLIIKRMFGTRDAIEAEIVGQTNEYMNADELIEAAGKAQASENQRQEDHRAGLRAAATA